ncbi:methylated-DNA--protein-cysteine methyltransferase [Alkaliphilus metalliredigens QYMF]|uniref:Methylated-DNA--protein-cysteine methyltransferase n=1 Tax=Alkaliphilus metalliredigens (strain QYMF) TaxID=293826 RepID=A6TTX3_ALKMQ|nr:methylated-DNA--[protein]-cysteine S-methyltransferase [Alkaliphilus metalliredigens]ABR49641.1 methylated-DNA--protein-cysteine methyltransferase [Alkaliphilus metalliredigens QYMF]
MPVYFYETSIGKIGIAEKNGNITNLYFETDKPPEDIEINETPLLQEAAQQLQSYLTGDSKEFNLPLKPSGTDFMEQVWESLCKIPYGKTVSYKEIAVDVDSPKAVRAVGLANNRNPIPIFIPCHRVIGSDGSLVGYGGGLELKERLIGLETMKNSCGFFQYGQKEIAYLKKKDKKLGAAIERIGKIERGTIADPFTALISSIVSQQISNKAAETVWNRLDELLESMTPESITKTELSQIQGCGMTNKKAEYIKGIADVALCGKINFKTLHMLSDQEIIQKLSSLHGVGIWTVEMLLIFSLNRPNVVSYGDLAIRRGMMNLYGLKELSKEQFNQYRAKYAPYGSVASLYLWVMSED